MASIAPEHKATMALVLLEDVMAGEHRLWFREALDTRWPVTSEAIHRTFALLSVSRDDLAEIGLDEEEIKHIEDETLTELPKKIRDHYVIDGYWQELKYHTGHVFFLRESSEESQREV